MVEALRGGVQGALRGERPRMELVDDSAEKVATPPVVVRPAHLGGVEDSGRPVDAMRLPGGARIGQVIATIQAVGVVGAGGQGPGAHPPAALARFHRHHLVRDGQVKTDASRLGGPYRYIRADRKGRGAPCGGLLSRAHAAPPPASRSARSSRVSARPACRSRASTTTGRSPTTSARRCAPPSMDCSVSTSVH